MKFNQRAISALLTLAAVPLAFAEGPVLRGARGSPAERAGSNTLSLPRLKDDAAAPVAKAKFDDHSPAALAGAAGGRRQSQRDVDYVAIDGGSTWSGPLRGSPHDVVFISFCANASLGTELDCAGALLRVEAADDPGKANLVVVGSEGSSRAARPRVIRCPLDT